MNSLRDLKYASNYSVLFYKCLIFSLRKFINCNRTYSRHVYFLILILFYNITITLFIYEFEDILLFVKLVKFSIIYLILRTGWVGTLVLASSWWNAIFNCQAFSSAEHALRGMNTEALPLGLQINWEKTKLFALDPSNVSTSSLKIDGWRDDQRWRDCQLDLSILAWR